MARKRRRKRSWLRTLLIFILTPLVIWLFAFLIWFYWDDIAGLFSKEHSSAPSKAAQKLGEPKRAETPAEKRSQEKILDEDRKKLDAIIKQRQ